VWRDAYLVHAHDWYARIMPWGAMLYSPLHNAVREDIPRGYVLWYYDLIALEPREYGYHYAVIAHPHLRAGRTFFPLEYGDILGGLAQRYEYLLVQDTLSYTRCASANPDSQLLDGELIPRTGLAPEEIICEANVVVCGARDEVFERALLEVLE